MVYGEQEDKKCRIKFMIAFGILSVILSVVIQVPLMPSASFLKYDPADILILVGTFLFGVWNGLALTLFVGICSAVFFSSGSAISGMIMYCVSTGIGVVVAGIIYHMKPTEQRAMTALICAVFVQVLGMVCVNLICMPIFMDIPREEVMMMVVPIIIPFNFMKCSINAIGAFLLYQSISKVI